MGEGKEKMCATVGVLDERARRRVPSVLKASWEIPDAEDVLGLLVEGITCGGRMRSSCVGVFVHANEMEKDEDRMKVCIWQTAYRR